MLNEIIKRVHNLSIDQQKDVLHFLKLFSHNEERRYARKKARLSIDAVAAGRLIQADTENISAGGVYISVTGQFKLGERARIVFQVPDHHMPFKIKGELVRVESNGIAIRFRGLSPYFEQILNEAIWNE